MERRQSKSKREEREEEGAGGGRGTNWQEEVCSVVWRLPLKLGLRVALFVGKERPGKGERAKSPRPRAQKRQSRNTEDSGEP